MARTSIVSEEIEPFAAMIMGRLFARCEAVKDEPHKLETACGALLYAAIGLHKIAIAIRVGVERYNDPQGLHFSIASMNNLRLARDHVRAYGFNPETMEG